MEIDPQAVINEIARQRNEALDRCAVLASEISKLKRKFEDCILKEKKSDETTQEKR